MAGGGGGAGIAGGGGGFCFLCAEKGEMPSANTAASVRKNRTICLLPFPKRFGVAKQDSVNDGRPPATMF